MLILTKPRDLIRTPGTDVRFARMIQQKYPLSAEKLRQRAQRYNLGVARAKEYEAQGRLLIVAPDDTCGVDTLTRDREALKRFYNKGYQVGQAISDFLSV